jgi:hypothetical protein
MSRALRVAAAASILVLFAVVAAPVGAQPAGPGPGNSPNAKACRDGGWETLYRTEGGGFSSQGQCVSYAAKGGELTTSRFATTMATCNSLGGRFELRESPFELWGCVFWGPNATGDDFVAGDAALGARCLADGGVSWATFPDASFASTLCGVQ